MAGLERWLAPMFAKLPHLPPHARETLAGVAPWLALLGGILGLLGVFSAGFLTSVLFSYAWFGGGMANLFLTVSLLIAVLASVLDLLAYTPLTARKKRGWNLIFYGAVLSAVSVLLNVIFGYGTLFGLVGSFIGLWLLFEIRGMYA
jgi:hypothetical protein